MTTIQIIGLVVVVLLAALAGFFIIRKSEKHSLVKWVSLFIIVAFALTWIFSYGYFNGADFNDYGMSRLGLTDLPNIIYYAMNFAGDKIIFLLAIGCFYAVLSKIEGYKKLVTNLAEKLKGKEILFVLIASLLFVAMAALFGQTFISLIFVPFVISIVLSMNLDRLTAFSVTFGSVLIGTLGTVYGGEGLEWFNYYTGLTVTTGIIYRLVVLVVGYILFNLFNVLHIKKTLKDTKVDEKEIDPFRVEKVAKDAKSWPIIVVFAILFVIMILGYVGWEKHFEIKIFSEFHTWLMGLKIGDIEIFKSILGTLAANAAFGTWNLFHMSILLFIISILVALLGRVKFNDFISSCGEGAKKMSKSIILFVLVYMVMIVVYMCPVMPTITNVIFSGISKFNPFLVSLMAFIANIFHTDFGFTGYVIGTFFVNKYAANVEVIHLIFTTMYGFVQLCVPTSAILLIGLSYLNIDYKTWMKYVWMFIVAILVILLVLFTVLTYI